MDETPGRELTADEVRTIRFLRRLVTALTLVMAAGMLAVVGLLALRLTRSPPVLLPDRITLPAGVAARAVTAGEGWFLVLTDRGEVLVYDSETGVLRQRVPIE